MIAVFAILLIPFAAIWNGWALSVLWGWFVVPVFALPPLSVAPAIGISMVVGYLTHQPTVAQEHKGDEGLVYAIIVTAVRPMIALSFGWVVHQFM